MTGALGRDLAAFGLVTVAVGAVFALAEAARRLAGWETEHTRKVAHVGSGLVAAAFPWLFSSRLSVGVLTAAFGVLMAVTAGASSPRSTPWRGRPRAAPSSRAAWGSPSSPRPVPRRSSPPCWSWRSGTQWQPWSGGATADTRTASGGGALRRRLRRALPHDRRRRHVGAALPGPAPARRVPGLGLAVAALATTIEIAAQDGSERMLLPPVAVALALAPATGPAGGAALTLVVVATAVLASLLDAARRPAAAGRARPAPARSTACSASAPRPSPTWRAAGVPGERPRGGGTPPRLLRGDVPAPPARGDGGAPGSELHPPPRPRSRGPFAPFSAGVARAAAAAFTLALVLRLMDELKDRDVDRVLFPLAPAALRPGAGLRHRRPASASPSSPGSRCTSGPGRRPSAPPASSSTPCSCSGGSSLPAGCGPGSWRRSPPTLRSCP